MKKYEYLPFQNSMLIGNLLFFLGMALIVDGFLLQQSASYSGILRGLISKPFLSESWNETTFIVASILLATSSLLHQINYWRYYRFHKQ